MSRRVGQVTAAQALAGGVVIMLLVIGVVALCSALLLPTQTVPELEAPAQETGAVPGGVRCPEAVDVTAATEPLSVTASTLVDCPDLYDERLVTYEGEVVGTVLQRGARAWVQLNDDAYGLAIGPLPEHRTTVGGNSGIAVSIPVEVARQIERVGGYDAQGDVLEVLGTFRRADPDDGGGPTIHADAATVAVRGRVVSHPVSERRLMVAAALALLTALMAGLSWGRRRI